jgi:hypothetical protein
MASYEAEGIVLIDSWRQAEGRDLIFRKPIHAKVGRTYRILDQSQQETILAEAVEYAESQGWRLTDPRTNQYGTGYGGSKDLAPGRGRLGISVVPADPLNDPNGPKVLSINLDYGTVRFDVDATTSST